MPKEDSNCVLLADRHLGLTESVRGLLKSQFGTVVTVADAHSLLESARRLQPQVAVVDLSLSRESNLDWLRKLHLSCAGVKVLVISVHNELSTREAAQAAGADAFVLKSEIATDLMPAIDALLAGSLPTRPGITTTRQGQKGHTSS